VIKTTIDKNLNVKGAYLLVYGGPRKSIWLNR
jgi:hypothetical protein